MKTQQIQKTGLIILLILSLLMGYVHASGTEASEHQSPATATEYKWDTYAYGNSAYRMEYPTVMFVSPQSNGVTSFTFWGESQQPSTRLTDGIMMEVDYDSLPPQTSLKEFVAARVNELKKRADITDVANERLATLDTLKGYAVDAIGEVTETHYYFQPDEKTYIEITVSVADPHDKGYNAITTQMLESLDII
jgi:hypothetical protein